MRILLILMLSSIIINGWATSQDLDETSSSPPLFPSHNIPYTSTESLEETASRLSEQTTGNTQTLLHAIQAFLTARKNFITRDQRLTGYIEKGLEEHASTMIHITRHGTDKEYPPEKIKKIKRDAKKRRERQLLALEKSMSFVWGSLEEAKNRLIAAAKVYEGQFNALGPLASGHINDDILGQILQQVENSLNP